MIKKGSDNSVSWSNPNALMIGYKTGEVSSIIEPVSDFYKLYFAVIFIKKQDRRLFASSNRKKNYKIPESTKNNFLF